MVSELLEVTVVQVDHFFVVVCLRRLTELILRGLGSAASAAAAQCRTLMGQMRFFAVIVLLGRFLRLLVERGLARLSLDVLGQLLLVVVELVVEEALVLILVVV